MANSVTMATKAVTVISVTMEISLIKITKITFITKTVTNVHYVKCLLFVSDFNRNSNVSTNFRKN
jgi:hypothetical protein